MNNPAVFDELYSQYKSSLYRLACYLTRNQKEAEDLFQDTWLRIAKHLAPKIFQAYSDDTPLFCFADYLDFCHSVGL